jgi:hypothetical protein
MRSFEKAVKGGEHGDSWFVYDREADQLIARSDESTADQDRAFIRFYMKKLSAV